MKTIISQGSKVFPVIPTETGYVATGVCYVVEYYEDRGVRVLVTGSCQGVFPWEDLYASQEQAEKAALSHIPPVAA